MEVRKQCRVCKVWIVKSDLDLTGRCKSCAAAKAATDAGTTYGKMQGAIYAEKDKEEFEKRKEERRLAGERAAAEKERLAMEAEVRRLEEEEKANMENGKKCLFCGKALKGRQLKFCCKECQYQYYRTAILSKAKPERNERNEQSDPCGQSHG